MVSLPSRLGRPHYRVALAGLLLAMTAGYALLLVITYFQTAAPNRLAPTMEELDRLLFHPTRQISPLERRLASSNVPLGTGPLIVAEPADQTHHLTHEQLIEREGERQALLAWIRSGASQQPYENDDFPLSSNKTGPISSEFLGDVSASPGRRHVRIRSLIHARCLGCHDENGDDTARLIPLGTYEDIARYLGPEAHIDHGRTWVLSALGLLFPLSGISAIAFAFGGSARLYRPLIAIVFGAVAVVGLCLLSGSGSLPWLLPAAAVVLIGSLLQTMVTAQHLLTLRSSP